MPYCPDCGHIHPAGGAAPEAEAEAIAAEEAAGAAEGVAETVSTAEVEIARIQADRDVTLAKIEKGIIAQEIEARETENEVKAELLDDVLAPPEPEPVPVVVEEAPAEEIPSEEPPPVIEAEPEPAGKRKGNPWW